MEKIFQKIYIKNISKKYIRTLCSGTVPIKIERKRQKRNGKKREQRECKCSDSERRTHIQSAATVRDAHTYRSSADSKIYLKPVGRTLCSGTVPIKKRVRDAHTYTQIDRQHDRAGWKKKEKNKEREKEKEKDKEREREREKEREKDKEREKMKETEKEKEKETESERYRVAETHMMP